MPQDKNEISRSKVGYWLKFIKSAKKYKPYKSHVDDGLRAWCEYELGERDESSPKTPRGYPIYHSSCEILEPAYFGKEPQIVSNRRFGSNDEMANTMALIAERLSQSVLDNGYFLDGITGVRGNFINCSKATAQVIYSARTENIRVPLSQRVGKEGLYEEGSEEVYEGDIEEDSEGAYYTRQDVVEDSQKIILAPVLHDEILHTPTAKTQADITEICYKFCLPREIAEELFNPDGSKSLPYKKAKDPDERESDDAESFEEVLYGWECWCKHTKMVYWVCEEYSEDFLKKEADPYGLAGFFPSPRFAIASKPRKHMFPTPKFIYLEGTINQLHRLYARMFELIDAIKRVAIMDSSLKELQDALNNLTDAEYVTSADIQDVLQTRKLSDLVHYVPVQELVQAVTECVQLEDHFKQNFYEMFHVPDILRGITDPSDTVGAQEIAADSAHDTFKYNKKQLIDLARDSAEMMLDLALKFYSDQKIARICGHEFMERGTPGNPGQPPTPENPQGIPPEPPRPGHYERFFDALALLRNDTERMIRIDFETDSTSFRDEAREINKRKLIMDTALNGLGTIGGMQNPEFANTAMELLLSLLDGIGGSKHIEDSVKKAYDDFQKSKENPAPPPPDVEMLKVQTQQQKIQLDAQKNQVEAMAKSRELDQKEGKLMQEAQAMQLEQGQKDFERKVEAARLQIELRNQRLLEIVEMQRLALDDFKAKVTAQESAIEEIRLAKETELEQLRIDTEKTRLTLETLMATVEQPKEVQAPKAESPKLPDIHVHLGGKRKSKVTSSSGNSYDIESEDIQ